MSVVLRELCSVQFKGRRQKGNSTAGYEISSVGKTLRVNQAQHDTRRLLQARVKTLQDDRNGKDTVNTPILTVEEPLPTRRFKNDFPFGSDNGREATSVDN